MNTNSFRICKFFSVTNLHFCQVTGFPFHCVYQLIFVHNLNHRTNSSVRVLHLKDAMENGIYVDKKGESRTPSPSTKERIKSMFRLSLKK